MFRLRWLLVCLFMFAVAGTAFASYRYFKSRELASLVLPPQADDVPMTDTASGSASLASTSGTPAAANPNAGFTSPTASASAVQIPILMYHYIEHVTDLNDTFRMKLAIFPEVLDLQLKTLKGAGYTFLTMEEVGKILNGQMAVPEKPIVLTFDDGYRDFYTDAFPILKKENVKATAYIVSEVIGKPNYMFLPQLEEVAKSGFVEIGAHTEHHINLAAATLKQATKEIDGSKTDLEKITGTPVLTFAYPGGRFNPQAVKIVEDAGFTTAVSTMPGTAASATNRFILYRLRPGSRTNSNLLHFLATVPTAQNTITSGE